MSYSTEISTAATTRLRTLQSSSSVVTTAFVTPTSSALGHSGNSLEMAKRTEIEPLLASPSHEPQYTSDKLNDNSIMSSSIHLSIEEDKQNPGLSMNHEVDENLHSYHEDDDRSLLIADKPLSIRTQIEHVYLFNFLALLFVFVNMTLNLTVLAIIHERVPMNEPHLPDIAFDILPDSRVLLDVAEYFIVFQMVSVVLLLFFHKHRYFSCLLYASTNCDSSQIHYTSQSLHYNGSDLFFSGHLYGLYSASFGQQKLSMLTTGIACFCIIILFAYTFVFTS